MDFLSILNSDQDTRCEDRRDKVYALLSLAPPIIEMLPNYSISVAELFLQLCRGIWEGGGCALARLLQSFYLEREELAYLLQMLLDGPRAEQLCECTDDQMTMLLNSIINAGLERLDSYAGGGDFRKLGMDRMRMEARAVLGSLRNEMANVSS